MTAAGKPEDQYRHADRLSRRRIEHQVVEGYRPNVRALVRHHWPLLERCWDEAEHVGCIGLLDALKSYDPARAAFWTFARSFVRNAIQKWVDVGVYWRPRTRKHRAGVDPREARAHMRPESMDRSIDDDAQTLHDVVQADGPTVEDLAAADEVSARLADFMATLTKTEVDVILSENSQRIRSRRYGALVERATAFVRGSDDDGLGDDVRLHSGTTRVAARVVPGGEAKRTG
jgi:RNA polymerase sigma factor (sigma-70 family)